MKFVAIAFAGLVAARADQAVTNPISKVVQLISDLQAKVIQEGEEAQKLYAGLGEFCEDRARELTHSIATGESEVETLSARIAEETATTMSLSAKLEELGGGLATDEADLKAATEIREHEQKAFAAEEAELSETISMLERAVGILEREMSKGGSSLLQAKNVNVKALAQALSTMVQAAGMTSADAGRLTALLQNGAAGHDAVADAEDDAEMGAPAAAVYEGQSGNIVDVLKDLREKAQDQLDEARKAETNNMHNFEMLKQSIEDEVKFGNKDMVEAKNGLAASGENKANADGDLAVTSKDLAADTEAKADLHRSCMTSAEDFEAETKSRGEELEALAKAKEAIVQATGGGAASFAQVASQISSSVDLANFEVVRMIRDLARREQSVALSQFALRLSVAAGSSSADPFGKIKGLISDMIAKLESEAAADSTKKTYCDKEMSETNAKHEEKSALVSKLTSKIDQMTSHSESEKSEVAALQADLAKLAETQGTMDKLRSEEHAAFETAKAETEQGLSGVKMALKILSEYYAKDPAHTSASGASGAGASIIGLLEVVESDFSKQLAELVTVEETASTAYDRETKENEIERAAKTKDVEYKTRNAASLDKEVTSVSSDRGNVESELDAITQYLNQIKAQCVEVAESFADRKGHREAEIAGLKEALTVLENEVTLVQRPRRLRRRVSALIPGH